MSTTTPNPPVVSPTPVNKTTWKDQITSGIITLLFLSASFLINVLFSQGLDGVRKIFEVVDNNASGIACISLVSIILFIILQQIVLNVIIARKVPFVRVNP